MAANLQAQTPLNYSNAFVPPKLTTRSTVVLPGTLRKPTPPPNEYDLCLSRDYQLWKCLVSHGNLQKYCCPQGKPKYEKKPWVQMPASGRRFKPIGTLLVSDAIPFTGTDILVPFAGGPEYVPLGYDGVISDIVFQIVSPGGTGFVDGSGDITWRLSADNRYLRDQGNVKVTIGSLVTPSPVPRGNLRVYSHDLLQIFVNFAVGAEARINPAARIVVSITGWYWAR